jgi:formylmethanofuran dehydrogenase subunit E
VVAKPNAESMDRAQRQEFILTAPMEQVFSFGKPRYKLPEKARLFTTAVCEICGEGAPEHKMRLQDEKKRSRLDCFQDYSRGW